MNLSDTEYEEEEEWNIKLWEQQGVSALWVYTSLSVTANFIVRLKLSLAYTGKLVVD